MTEQNLETLRDAFDSATVLLKRAKEASELETISSTIRHCVRILEKAESMTHALQRKEAEVGRYTLTYKDALRTEIPLSLFSLRESVDLDEWDFLNYWLARVADYVAWKIDWANGSKAKGPDLEIAKGEVYQRLLEMIFGHDGKLRPYPYQASPNYGAARGAYYLLRKESDYINLPVAVVTLGEMIELFNGGIIFEEMATYCALQVLANAGELPAVDSIANLAYGRRSGAPNPSKFWCKEATACCESLIGKGFIAHEGIRSVLTRREVSDNDISAWIVLRFPEAV